MKNVFEQVQPMPENMEDPAEAYKAGLENAQVTVLRDMVMSLLGNDLQSYEGSTVPLKTRPADLVVWAENKANRTQSNLRLQVFKDGDNWVPSGKKSTQMGEKISAYDVVTNTSQKRPRRNPDSKTPKEPLKKKFRGSCNFCKKVGHKESECRQKKKQGKENTSASTKGKEKKPPSSDTKKVSVASAFREILAVMRTNPGKGKRFILDAVNEPTNISLRVWLDCGATVSLCTQTARDRCGFEVYTLEPRVLRGVFGTFMAEKTVITKFVINTKFFEIPAFLVQDSVLPEADILLGTDVLWS